VRVIWDAKRIDVTIWPGEGRRTHGTYEMHWHTDSAGDDAPRHIEHCSAAAQNENGDWVLCRNGHEGHHAGNDANLHAWGRP
jgi:hypothetical protein